MSSVPTLTLWASASVSSACASDDVPGVVELALGHRQRERRPAGDVRRRLAATAASSSSAGTTALTRPSSSASGAAHHPRRERELLGPVHADALAQQPRRAEVEAEPALGEDGREARPVRAPRSGRRRARGRSRHRRTRRRPWRSPAPGIRGPPAPTSPSTRIPSSWLPIGPLERRRRLAPPLPLEVGAGAEVAAGAGEHDDARARVGDARGTSRRWRPTCRRCTRSWCRDGRW